MSEIDVVSFAGILYGDGYLTKTGNLAFKHSLVQQQYVEMKVAFCENRFLLKHNSCITKKQEGGFAKNDFYNVRFHTKAWTKELRNSWYVGSKKSIPPSVISQFGWQEWAFVFQDDGRQNKISHMNCMVDGNRVRTETAPVVNRYEICTGFPSDDELDALMHSLIELGVESSVITRKDGQRNISISRAESKIRFYEGIYPLLHSTMQYKMSASPTFKYLNVND